MEAEFKEKLPSGKGFLIVTISTWYIQYYFPGIDNRHNGTYIKITKELVDEYIAAYKMNWLMYVSIKEKSTNIGGEIKLSGEKNMTINIGGYHDGVCIQSYHLPLNTEEKINKIVYDYQWAKERAESIMEMLKKLN